jgi:nucleotide-binding universal stress UspA family protein
MSQAPEYDTFAPSHHLDVVEGRPDTEPVAKYAHIAVCLDNSEASLDALDEAWGLRRSLGAGQLSLVYVIEIPRAGGYGVVWMPDSSQRDVDQHPWLAELVAAHPGSSAVVLAGYPAAEVCDWALAANVDLLVASASRGLFDRVLLGSFAGFLAHHSPCAVLLSRPAVVRDNGDASAQAAKADHQPATT